MQSLWLILNPRLVVPFALAEASWTTFAFRCRSSKMRSVILMEKKIKHAVRDLRNQTPRVQHCTTGAISCHFCGHALSDHSERSIRNEVQRSNDTTFRFYINIRRYFRHLRTPSFACQLDQKNVIRKSPEIHKVLSRMIFLALAA